MKHSVEEHIANIRKNVPGMKPADILKRMTSEAIERNCAQSERTGGKMSPIGIDCDSIMEQEDKIAKDIIAIVGAVLDFELKDAPKVTEGKKK
jgi:hypothetical protein